MLQKVFHQECRQLATVLSAKKCSLSSRWPLFTNLNLHNGRCQRHPTLTDVGAVVQAYESFMPPFLPQFVMNSSILVDSSKGIRTLSVATSTADIRLREKTTRGNNVTDYTIDNDAYIYIFEQPVQTRRRKQGYTLL